MAPKNKLPFVLFSIKECLYAVPADQVREILLMPQVTSVANVPAEVRGVINLRGKVIKLLDLRLKLGLSSSRSELEALTQLLREREADHVTWLTELEACVQDRRPFTLAQDPCLCKFGKWYCQFKTENSLLRMTLQKMDEPHRAIHATADQALQLAEKGEIERARELIEARRGHELSALSKLFDEARRLLVECHREVAVVLQRGEERMAISVDAVEAVERIPEESIEPLASVMNGLTIGLQGRVAKRAKTSQTIILLEDRFCFGGDCAP